MTPRTPQCEVFWALLSSSEHSGVPEDSKSPTFPSVGLHPHTWPKWGCDTPFELFIVNATTISLPIVGFKILNMHDLGMEIRHICHTHM